MYKFFIPPAVVLALLFTGCANNGAQNQDQTAGKTQLDDGPELLIGSWEYVSVTYDGKSFDFGQNSTIEIDDENWIIFRNGQTIRSTWTVDAKTTPKHLNQKVQMDDGTSFMMKSIYRFDDDQTLTLCEPDHPDKPRPVEFTAKPNDGQFLINLRRVK